jgi:3-isopropylmalate dehydratase
MAAAAAVTGTLTDVRDLPSIPIAPKDDTVFLELLKALEKTTASKSNLPAIQALQAEVDSKLASQSGGQVSRDESKTFIQLKSKAAKLDLQNIDTDMIIPKQFLKTIKRSGLGVSCFYDMRYDAQGQKRPDFILNQPKYEGSKILVVGDNFGCGSSREHAPWALKDLGIQVLIGTSFADIFYNNCFKNGMLPITLNKDDVAMLMRDCDEGLELDINLESQTITRADGKGVITFEVDSFRRHCLLNGLDDIGLTMQLNDQILSFEKKRSNEFPWLDNAAQQYV